MSNETIERLYDRGLLSDRLKTISDKLEAYGSMAQGVGLCPVQHAAIRVDCGSYGSLSHSERTLFAKQKLESARLALGDFNFMFLVRAAVWGEGASALARLWPANIVGDSAPMTAEEVIAILKDALERVGGCWIT